ncbi:MAG: hypothetical protein ACYC7A_07995 [Thermoanaerobaculia bacterium]
MTVDGRPKWLVALEAADTDEKLLLAVEDAVEAAVQGFLRAHNLGDPGLHSERARAIKDAIDRGALSMHDLSIWRNEVLACEAAVTSVADFRKKHPLIEEFRIKHKFPPGNDAAVLESILDALWRGDLELRDWCEFFDAHRHETDRHLFLYRVPTGGVALPVASAAFEWHPAQPTLVHASSSGNGRTIELRWVGWRSPTKPGGKEIRAVTFAHLDLTRGTMVLQLQRVRGGGMPVLLAERDIYLHEIAELLKIRPEPIRLEPAIRALLMNKRMTLRYWLVRTPEGGELSGKGEPGLFERARLGFERFYALELRGRWKATPTVDVMVWMSARTDAIDIRAQCDPAVLGELTSIVREQIDAAPEVAVEVPSPAGSTAKDGRLAELKALLEKVIEYQRRLGEDVAVSHPSRRTTSDLLFAPETLREALRLFGVRSLGLTLYVTCPRTGTPVRQDGRIVAFDRLDEIPEEILCENEGEVRRHPTKENVWLKVGPGIEGDELSPRVAWILYALALTGLTAMFAWLRDRFPSQQWIILIGFMLAVLAPVAAIYRTFGKRAFSAAFEVVRWILDMFLSLTRKKSGSEAPPENQAEPEDEEDNTP